MSEKTKKILFPLLTLIPLVLISMMIFGFSSETAEESSERSGRLVDFVMSFIDTSEMDEEELLHVTNTVTRVIRKTAHFTEYAMLGFFTLLHLLTFLKRKRQLYAAAFSLLYACSDEFHQNFVSERAMRLLDVGIDFAGALAGICALTVLVIIIDKIKNKKQNKCS